MRVSKKAAAVLVCMALVFCAAGGAFAVEMTLAGIKLSSGASVVLKKYGNPTRVTVGTVAMPSTQPAAAQPAGAMPAPGGPGYAGALNPLAAMTGYYAAAAGQLDGAGGPPPMLPGLPGLPAPGAGMSGMPGLPGLPPVPGSPDQQNQATVVEQQVTWTYDMPDGITLEFIVSETGRIVQITVGGDRPFALSRTSKGIKLGNYYKDVIFKYGYPESHSYAGRFLRTSYADKHRCVFTFLGKKLVGITIALKTE